MKLQVWLGAGVVASLATLACSTAVPTETPGVTRVGATALRYAGPEIEAVVSYRFAEGSVGDEWMLLDVAFTGAGHDTVEVKRDNVSLRAPSGEEIALAAQEEFAAAYGTLAPVLARADVAAEPLDYWSSRVERPIEFFTVPGAGLVFPSFWVDDRRVYLGRLFFQVPGGIQTGRWELRIKLPETQLAVPFRLGSP